MTSWKYQGVDGMPILSKTAARKIRDISLTSIELFQQAIRRHGPLPGYAKSLESVVRSYANARAFLRENR